MKSMDKKVKPREMLIGLEELIREEGKVMASQEIDSLLHQMDQVHNIKLDALFNHIQ
jgi:hypothetical protein